MTALPEPARTEHLDARRVRACRPDDVSCVADLWVRVFGHRDEPAPASLTRCMREVLLEHPLSATGVGSLVLVGADDRPVGFIGLMPRRMEYRGRPILAAVATQLMVDPKVRGFAAFELLRAVFSGPQELTFSDGANELAQPIWERLGGEVARLQSLEWLRVLRPAHYAAFRLERAGARAAWVTAGSTLARPVDALASRMSFGALRRPSSALATEPATAADLLASLDAVRCSLRPRHELAELAWLLERAGDALRHGPLRARIVRGASGEPVGWFVHYAKPGGLSQVLQLGATRPRMEGPVLDALLADAYACGCVAATGQGEPRFLRELHDRHAVLTCPSLGVLVHAKDPAITATIQRSDAFLSRLDGEWWVRFAELSG